VRVCVLLMITFCDHIITKQVVASFSESIVYLPHVYQANNFTVTTPMCGGAHMSTAQFKECQHKIRLLYSSHDSTTTTADTCSNSTMQTIDSTCDNTADTTTTAKTADTATNTKSTNSSSAIKRVNMCNFNNVDKFEPSAFRLLLRILRRAPHAVLILLEPAQVLLADVSQNLLREAAIYGIHTSRIEFHPRLDTAQHLQRLSGVCDVFVDTLVYSAHTTASEALWAGVPLLSMAGYGVDSDILPIGKMPARVGTSMLASMGKPLSHLTFHTIKVLEDSAVRLIQHPTMLLLLRQAVLKAALTSTLFDLKLFTTNMEAAYQAIWEVYDATTTTASATATVITVNSTTAVSDKKLMHVVVNPEQSSADRPNGVWLHEILQQGWCMVKQLQQQSGNSDAVHTSYCDLLALSNRVLAVVPAHIDALRLKALALQLSEDSE
jgi:Glycosyl transferase family 41